jgi:SAM-dependent methyltransferase
VGKDILELGCGAARWSTELARMGARPVGLDNSARQLEHARGLMTGAGVEFPLVHASAEENRDLFWALRGGGGNFGIATAFTFRAHKQATVIAGPMLWPIDQTADVLRFYRDFMAAAPDDVNGFFAILTVPPGPPFPEELHSKAMCGIVWCCTNGADEANAALAPARALSPALDGVSELPLPALQSAFDPLYPPGLQTY